MAYSFIDLAFDVLKEAQQPLIYQEIGQSGQNARPSANPRSVGKTPWNTLGAHLYVDVRDNESSRFMKVGKRPAREPVAAKSATRSRLTSRRLSSANPRRRPSRCSRISPSPVPPSTGAGQ